MMILHKARSARRTDALRAPARLRTLKRVVPAIAAVLAGCLGTRADLNRGDMAPTIIQSRGRMTVVLAASVDDCLSCDLRGVFVALRALQGRGTGGLMPELVVLAVTGNARDTLFFRQTLDRQRVTGRIERIAPRGARRMFDENRLPAMYLIEDGRVVHEWEPIPDQGTVLIGRGELVDAATKQDEL